MLLIGKLLVHLFNAGNAFGVSLTMTNAGGRTKVPRLHAFLFVPRCARYAKAPAGVPPGLSLLGIGPTVGSLPIALLPLIVVLALVRVLLILLIVPLLVAALLLFPLLVLRILLLLLRLGMLILFAIIGIVHFTSSIGPHWMKRLVPNLVPVVAPCRSLVPDDLQGAGVKSGAAVNERN